MIDPDDYWINNPLITPINKCVMYDSDIYDAVIGERERIGKLWELEMACDCEEAMQHLKQRIQGENK